MKNRVFLILPFLLFGTIYAGFDLKSGYSTPPYIAPGGTFSVTISAMHSVNKHIFLAGVISADKIWNLNDDYLFLYKGGEGKDPEAPPVDGYFATTADVTYGPLDNTSYIDYQWTTKMPTTFTEGQTVYLIIRGNEVNSQWIGSMTTTDDIIIPVNVSNTKGVVYNTATFGEKKATGALVLVSGPPDATLSATPGDTTYETLTLDITLSTDKENKIYYTTDGSDPDTTNSAQLLNSGNNSGIVTISGDVTVKAIAIGSGYTATSKEWHYDCQLPSITISSNPLSGTHFTMDTTVTLTAFSENTELSGAKIYYTTDGTTPDSLTGTPYSSEITIKKSTTIKAVAYKSGYIDGTGTFVFTMDLSGTYIIANPDTSELFGKSMVCTLTTNATTILYTTDGSNPLENGTVYTKPFTITKDSVTVKGVAFGDGFDTTYGSWTYYKKYLHLEANPADTSFVGMLNITLTEKSGWHGTKIYYTTDGSTPDSNSTLYSGSIKITTTTTLKAIAYADNAVKSKILTLKYTELFYPKQALYLDTSGNGTIDMVEIIFEDVPDKLPSSMWLVNPFDMSDTIHLGSSNVEWKNGDKSTNTIIVHPGEPFPFQGKTSFTTAPLGKITSGDYVSEQFDISDGIAPVIDSAVYHTGAIIDAENLKRAEDTLWIKFSEETNEDISYETPFEFLNTIDGSLYKLKLTKIAQTGEFAIFIVKEDLIANGIDLPTSGDSLRIDPVAAIKDMSGNIQENPKNRRVKLTMLPIPIQYDMKVLSPFEKNSTTALDYLKSLSPDIKLNSGGVVIFDFLQNLDSTTVESINCSVKIYDQVGNIVASKSDIHSISTSIESSIFTENRRCKLAIIWNGKNKNGRYVGIGNYITIINISTGSKKFSEKIYLGFKSDN